MFSSAYSSSWTTVAALGLSAAVGFYLGRCAKSPKKKQYLGAVIGLKREKYEEYKAYHANVWETVLDRLRKSNVRNFNIYYCKEKDLLYYHMEYVGDDYAADMALISKDPETNRWWAIMDLMQSPLEWSGPMPHQGGDGDGGKYTWWKQGEHVFHLD